MEVEISQAGDSRLTKLQVFVFLHQTLDISRGLGILSGLPYLVPQLAKCVMSGDVESRHTVINDSLEWHR